MISSWVGSWLSRGVVPCALAVAVVACGSAPHFEHRYRDGQLRLRGPTRSGLLHGEATAWHPNGVVESRGTYRDGQRHGVFEFFNDRGQFDKRVVFVEDAPIWQTASADAHPPSHVLVVFEREDHSDRDRRAVMSSARPAFATAEPIQGRSGVNAAVLAFTPITVGGLDHVGQRTTAGFEWIPERYGGYGRGAITASAPDSELTWGKLVLESGAVFQSSAEPVLLLGRLGVFATATGDDLAALTTERAASFSSVRDTIFSAPHLAGVRNSLSVLSVRGPWLGRLDGGLDYGHNLAGQMDYPRLESDVLLGRFNAALGLTTTKVIIAAELATAISLVGELDSAASMAFSVHLPLAGYQPHLSLVSPIAGRDALGAVALEIGLRAVPWQDGVR